MSVEILNGDVRFILSILPSNSFDCIVTSPPYWGLRDYGVEGQIGLEPTMTGYLETMVRVCRELRRVLKPEGTFWLNVGSMYAREQKTARASDKTTPSRKSAFRTSDKDVSERACYCGSCGLCFVYLATSALKIKSKDLLLIPDLLALALQADGWYVRSEIIWAKPNPMPESVTDRPTSAHEKIWLLTKSARYFYDADAIAEDGIIPAGTKGAKGSRERFEMAGVNSRPPEYKVYNGKRNARNVWSITTKPFKGAHFATFPPDLVERCIKAGCPVGGSVLDPFGGSGTTGMVADRLGRDATLIELNKSYVEIAKQRIELGK